MDSRWMYNVHRIDGIIQDLRVQCPKTTGQEPTLCPFGVAMCSVGNMEITRQARRWTFGGFHCTKELERTALARN